MRLRGSMLTIGFALGLGLAGPAHAAAVPVVGLGSFHSLTRCATGYNDGADGIPGFDATSRGALRGFVRCHDSKPGSSTSGETIDFVAITASGALAWRHSPYVGDPRASAFDGIDRTYVVFERASSTRKSSSLYLGRYDQKLRQFAKAQRLSSGYHAFSTIGIHQPVALTANHHRWWAAWVDSHGHAYQSKTIGADIHAGAIAGVRTHTLGLETIGTRTVLAYSAWSGSHLYLRHATTGAWSSATAINTGSLVGQLAVRVLRLSGTRPTSCSPARAPVARGTRV